MAKSRITVLIYPKRRVATVVVYAFYCLGPRPIVRKGIPLARVQPLLAKARRKDFAYVVRGDYAATAIAFMDLLSKSTLRWCVDRSLARLYARRIIAFKDDGMPEEFWRLWQERGLGAEVPERLVVDKTYVFLSKQWTRWILVEPPWIKAELVWLRGGAGRSARQRHERRGR